MERAIDLAERAIRHGWSVMVQQGADTAGDRWISVEGRRGGNQDGRFSVTWHTRKTGTYRLFSCMGGANKAQLADISLKKLNTIIEAAP